MKVDLIHPEGAPLFVQKRYTRSGEIVSELERRYAIPIVTTGMVLVEAARALGIKKLLVLSSFDDGRSADRLEKYRSCFSDAGFQVPAVEGFPVAFENIGSVSAHEAYAFVRKLYLKHPDSSGICMIGSGWRILDAVPLPGAAPAGAGCLRCGGESLGNPKKTACQAAGQRPWNSTPNHALSCRSRLRQYSQAWTFFLLFAPFARALSRSTPVEEKLR